MTAVFTLRFISLRDFVRAIRTDGALTRLRLLHRERDGN